MLQSLKTFILSIAVGCLFAAPFIVEIFKELNKMSYNQKQDKPSQGKPREWREAAKQKRNPVF